MDQTRVSGRTSVVVVGGINADVTCRCARLPRPGETVTAGDPQRRPGGKGANQAVAAARLGAAVRLVGAVGDDEAGRVLVDVLRAEHVDTAAVRVVPGPTGTAFVFVDDDAENMIVVAPGANLRAEVRASDLAGADAVLAQLEVPVETVEQAAAQTTGLFCLNAAPARDVPPALLQRCDLVVVNETEWEHLGGREHARLVALTRGAAGATLLAAGRVVAQVAPPRVEAVDSVGAGDAFAAALAVGLARGLGHTEALTFACTAGALATTRHGAQAALPTEEEVRRWLHDRA